MKSKQLANVLLKILGLWICLQAIPASIYRTVIAATSPHGGAIAAAAVVGYGGQAVMGIAIIAMSRSIAGQMFKDDED